MPRKVFTAGEVLAAADVNSFLMDQTVMTFAGTAARGSAIGTATEGMVTYLNDSNSLQVYDGSRWNAFGASSGNLIINGGFDIWQRGTSFTHTANMYTADRFRMSAETAFPTLRTVTQQTFTPNELKANGFGDARFYLRSTLTTIGSATAITIGTRVEDVRTLAGQSATLSFWAKSDTTRTQTVKMVQNFGTGGSSQVLSSSTTFSTTTSWQRFTFTVDVPDVSGKTIGDGSFMGPDWTQAFSAGSVLDLWGIQLEAGLEATDFRRNANSLQGELAACQRYYFRSTAIEQYSPFATGYAGAVATQSYFNVFPRVTMRAAATSIDFLNLAIGRTLLSGPFAASSVTLVGTGNGNNGLAISVVHANSGYTAVSGQDLIANGPGAFLGFSAEL
jgi:hypothetical protein